MRAVGNGIRTSLEDTAAAAHVFHKKLEINYKEQHPRKKQLLKLKKTSALKKYCYCPKLQTTKNEF